MITDDFDMRSCRISSTMTTIAEFICTIYVQRATLMAPGLGQKLVYLLVEGSDDRHEEAAPHATATVTAAFKD